MPDHGQESTLYQLHVAREKQGTTVMSMWGWINSWVHGKPDLEPSDRSSPPTRIEDDPRLAAAVEEARRRWPEFTAALARRRPEQTFAVLAPIREGDKVELVWLSDVGLEGDHVSGRLDNEPVELKQVRRGDRLQVLQTEVVDWSFEDGETMHGDFTSKARKQNQDATAG